MRPDGILETSLYCGDLAAAERFYGGVLGLAPIGRQEGRHLFFRCGAGVLLIFDPERTSREQAEVGGAIVPLHGAHGAGHCAFRVREAEIDAWRDRLSAAGVGIESEIAWPRGGRSLYVRDPAGNSVELATPEVWA